MIQRVGCNDPIFRGGYNPTHFDKKGLHVTTSNFSISKLTFDFASNLIVYFMKVFNQYVVLYCNKGIGIL